MRKTLPNETQIKFQLMPHAPTAVLIHGLGAYETERLGYKFRVHNIGDDYGNPLELAEKELWEVIGMNPINRRMIISDCVFVEMIEVAFKTLIQKHEQRLMKNNEIPTKA